MVHIQEPVLSNASFTGELAYDYAGTWASGAGDVNGDGTTMSRGSPVKRCGGERRGQAYLIFPELNTKPSSITSSRHTMR